LGQINVWADILLGKIYLEVQNVFVQGQLYTFSIALCAPFLATFLLGILIRRKYRTEEHFVSYKIICLLLDFLWILILTIMWTGNYRSSFIAQLISSIVSIVFSFYMFCIGEMACHPNMFDYDDVEYLKTESNNIKKTKRKAKKVKNIDSEGGKIQL